MQAARHLFFVVFAFCVSGSYGFVLPEHLEMVRQEGDYYTVRERLTGLEQTYYIPGGVVGEGWAVKNQYRPEPQDDSLIFELVADMHLILIEKLQAYDFQGDGLPELLGCDLVENAAVRFFENRGNFNFIEVSRVQAGILYDLGDGDRDGLIELLTKYDRSMFIYEQGAGFDFADSLVWTISPLEGNYRVWPRFTDLDDDGLREVSFENSVNYINGIEVHENTSDNSYDNCFFIRWSGSGPGDFTSGDVDGDGHTEVIGGTDYGIIRVFEAAGNDSFVQVWETSLGHPNAYMHQFIGDTDNDGYGEWVSGSHDFSRGGFFFKVFEATANNQYAVVYFDSLPGNPWGLGGIAAGDIDGDGFNEFVFSANANVGVYKHRFGLFWRRAYLLTPAMWTTFPHLLDVDGDQYDEMVLVGDGVQDYYTRIYDCISATRIEQQARPEKWLSVYPNPANGEIRIRFSTDYPGPLKISVFDISGRLIFEENMTNTDGRARFNLFGGDGNEVRSGVYFIKINDGNWQQIKKTTIVK